MSHVFTCHVGTEVTFHEFLDYESRLCVTVDNYKSTTYSFNLPYTVKVQAVYTTKQGFGSDFLVVKFSRFYFVLGSINSNFG